MEIAASILLLSLLGNAIAVTVVVMDWRDRKRVEKALLSRETELTDALKRFAELYQNSEMQNAKLRDTVGELQTKFTAISAQFSTGGFRR